MSSVLWCTAHDKLNFGCSEPLHQAQDYETGESVMRPKKGYGWLFHNNPAALNPFRRFEYKHHDNPADYAASNWHQASVGGYVGEAMVACRMEQDKSCLHCDQKGKLRWNGGFGVTSAWADVVCLSCHSSYEIKSKRDQKAVQKALITYGTVNGGSFLAFSKFEPRGRRYLVMVPRSPQEDTLGTPFHVVTVVEIDRVVPKLTDRSFDPTNVDNLKIGSRIFVKRATLKTWFTVPACRVPIYELVNAVYDNEFGAGQWQKRHPSKDKWLGVRTSSDIDLSLTKTFQGLHIGRGAPSPRSAYFRSAARMSRHNTRPTFSTIGHSSSTSPAATRWRAHRYIDESVESSGSQQDNRYEERADTFLRNLIASNTVSTRKRAIGKDERRA